MPPKIERNRGSRNSSPNKTGRGYAKDFGGKSAQSLTDTSLQTFAELKHNFRQGLGGAASYFLGQEDVPQTSTKPPSKSSTQRSKKKKMGSEVAVSGISTALADPLQSIAKEGANLDTEITKTDSAQELAGEEMESEIDSDDDEFLDAEDEFSESEEQDIKEDLRVNLSEVFIPEGDNKGISEDELELDSDDEFFDAEDNEENLIPEKILANEQLKQDEVQRLKKEQELETFDRGLKDRLSDARQETNTTPSSYGLQFGSYRVGFKMDWPTADSKKTDLDDKNLQALVDGEPANLVDVVIDHAVQASTSAASQWWQSAQDYRQEKSKVLYQAGASVLQGTKDIGSKVVKGVATGVKNIAEVGYSAAQKGASVLREIDETLDEELDLSGLETRLEESAKERDEFIEKVAKSGAEISGAVIQKGADILQKAQDLESTAISGVKTVAEVSKAFVKDFAHSTKETATHAKDDVKTLVTENVPQTFEQWDSALHKAEEKAQDIYLNPTGYITQSGGNGAIAATALIAPVALPAAAFYFGAPQDLQDGINIAAKEIAQKGLNEMVHIGPALMKEGQSFLDRRYAEIPEVVKNGFQEVARVGGEIMQGAQDKLEEHVLPILKKHKKPVAKVVQSSAQIINVAAKHGTRSLIMAICGALMVEENMLYLRIEHNLQAVNMRLDIVNSKIDKAKIGLAITFSILISIAAIITAVFIAWPLVFVAPLAILMINGREIYNNIFDKDIEQTDQQWQKESEQVYQILKLIAPQIASDSQKHLQELPQKLQKTLRRSKHELRDAEWMVKGLLFSTVVLLAMIAAVFGAWPALFLVPVAAIAINSKDIVHSIQKRISTPEEVAQQEHVLDQKIGQVLEFVQWLTIEQKDEQLSAEATSNLLKKIYELNDQVSETLTQADKTVKKINFVLQVSTVGLIAGGAAIAAAVVAWPLVFVGFVPMFLLGAKKVWDVSQKRRQSSSAAAIGTSKSIDVKAQSWGKFKQWGKSIQSFLEPVNSTLAKLEKTSQNTNNVTKDLLWTGKSLLFSLATLGLISGAAAIGPLLIISILIPIGIFLNADLIYYAIKKPLTKEEKKEIKKIIDKSVLENEQKDHLKKITWNRLERKFWREVLQSNDKNLSGEEIAYLKTRVSGDMEPDLLNQMLEGLIAKRAEQRSQPENIPTYLATAERDAQGQSPMAVEVSPEQQKKMAVYRAILDGTYQPPEADVAAQNNQVAEDVETNNQNEIGTNFSESVDASLDNAPVLDNPESSLSSAGSMQEVEISMTTASTTAAQDVQNPSDNLSADTENATAQTAPEEKKFAKKPKKLRRSQSQIALETIQEEVEK